MAQVAERLETYAAAFEAFRHDAAFGPEWLRAARVRAFDRFMNTGFPTTRDEEWRFTNVAPIAAIAFTHASEAAPDRAAVAPFLLDDADVCQLVVVNGRVAAGLSSAAGEPAGVTVRSIRDLVRNDGLEPALFPAPHPGATPFVDLNTALCEDGVVIDVAPRAIVARAVHVLHLTVANTPVVVSPRLIIRAAEQSEISVVESYAGLGGAASFTNAVTLISAGAGAVVRHVKLQREPPGAFHLASQAVTLGRASVVTSHAITLGGRIARNDIAASLAGEGAECTLNGLYVADGETLVDTHTLIDHTEPHCPSHEVYKGILSGRSRAVFNGKIIVRQKAQKTDAKQTNKALLLSDDAQINTKPQLEIFADDVKCTHGAAIGQLDPDQMFYLRARGLSAVAARNMLIHAFAGDVLDGVQLESARRLALRLVDEKLHLPSLELV
jgi:Fe-S cluster assembly protein SufD